MEFNGTTFILEIINFAVLVWLLKRFFYKPVVQAIENRQKAIEDNYHQAEEIKKNAEAVRADYLKSQASWAKELSEKKQALAQEISAEKEKRLAELEQILKDEEQRLRALQTHQQAEQWRALEEKAVVLASRFASRLLTHFSGESLEQIIIKQTIKDLSHLSEETKATLHVNLNKPDTNIQILTAFSLPEAFQQQIKEILTGIADTEQLTLHFETDTSLISGIYIAINAHEIHANLNRELAFFREIGHEN